MCGTKKKEGEASRAFGACVFFGLFVGVLASGKWLGCELPTWKTLNPRYGWAPFPSISNIMICHALLPFNVRGKPVFSVMVAGWFCEKSG